MGSAALAPPQVVDVTLSLFGGRKTDISPSDCPEGITPDEQDGIYVPGGWFSRPGLQKLYETGQLTEGTQVLYEKTYIQPNNDPLTLILTSDGSFWYEEVNNNPGTLVEFFYLLPGLYAQSVTADGREYIAFSDLLHGQGVPLQFDGTNLDRVTQDGPGAAPTVADLPYPTFNVAGSGVPGLQVVALPVAILSISEIGNTCTLIAAAGIGVAGPVQVGDWISVASTGVTGYEGFFQVTAVSGNDGAGYPTTVEYFNATTGLGLSTGGTLDTYAVLITTSAATPYIAGGIINVAGAGNALYDGQFQIRVMQSPTQIYVPMVPALYPSLPTAGGGTTQQVGMISQGTHQFVVMFLTRNGALTAPSPPGYWTAAGGDAATVSGLPIGPANVVARVLGFTGAGGDNFFTIPANVNLPNLPGPPIVIKATVVPDNTSTTATLDFSDNALFDAVAIDQIGNDLFDQRVLGPVLGFFFYASRLMCWGDYEKIENLLNMGFCGGYLAGVLTTPLGWTVVTAGGTLLQGGPWADGMIWAVTGDGTTNPKGQISQPAFQDAYGAPILSPSTKYIFRCWASAPFPLHAGQIVAQLYSPTAGLLASAAINCATLTELGSFVQANFNNETPAVIPADTVFRVGVVGVVNTLLVYLGELENVYQQDPYNNVLVRVSYAENPEGFAQTTGNLGASDDDSAVQCLALLRKPALLETLDGIHIFQDNDGEPDTWTVDSLTRAVGAVSLRGGDPGKFGTGDAAEDWALIASKNGAYLFAGGEFWKVSQEVSRGALTQAQDPRPTWDDINWAAEQTIVAKNDPAVRRAYFAVPISGAVYLNGSWVSSPGTIATTPNVIFVLDYREMDTATQIASAPPVHITIQGKMKSSDLTRKWSVWNVSANDLEILIRPGNQRSLFFAGGLRNGEAYGNMYSLNPAYLTDDDYGQIFPYYTTYAFTDHDQEQALGLGSDLHLYKAIHSFVAGVGWIAITPIVNSLYNFQPGLQPRQLTADLNAGTFLASDIEWSGIQGLTGQRVFFRISVSPLFPTTTDVQIRLQKFVVGMMKHPVAMKRQSAV